MKKSRRVFMYIGFAMLALALSAGGFFVWQIGPSNVIGILLYDTRREGNLKVGDLAPDVALTTPDGKEENLASSFGIKPLVLIFGSFT